MKVIGMKYLLRKAGMYYKPESRGYTNHLCMAGLFDEDYALHHSSCTDGEVQAIPVSSVEEISIKHLDVVIDNSKQMLTAISEAKEELAKAVHVPTEML